MRKGRSKSAAEIPAEPTERTIASRENGRRGGEARADRNDPVVLQEWSSRGGKKVLQKYGREYLVELRKKRKHYPSYWKSPLTLQRERLALQRQRRITNADNGRKGGLARTLLYSPENFRDWGRFGGKATRERHGSDFFREIRKMREWYPKGYMTRKTKDRLREDALEQVKTSPTFAIAGLWKAIAREWEP